MKGKVLMIQGTASHVGKSVLVTALCRIFHQDGFRVAPFKAQNMSLNSYVTPDGGEIGRAQAVQAEAAGIDPTVDMNPILLKPEAESRSQVVLLGKPLRSAGVRDYFGMRSQLWDAVATSLDRLRQQFEVVVIEGAGSPAEVNLKDSDIVNMRIARYANAPVVLVADIDRGGVFASLVGTLDLLEPAERALVRALVVNKFRGDATLFDSGVTFLEERTGIPVAGVVPYFHDIHIPEEDSVVLEKPRHRNKGSVLDVAVIRLPRISNFDDFDPLERESAVGLRYVDSAAALGSPDLIILPGSKATMTDLLWLRHRGLAQAITSLVKKGTAIIGICGGYQMLGERLEDPHGIESSQLQADGLGLLPVTTHFAPTKETHRIRGRVSFPRGLLKDAVDASVDGYEIHMGHTSGEGIDAPFRIVERSGTPWDRPDGAVDPSGRVMGTYIHGLFHNATLRRSVLQSLAVLKGVSLPASGEELDREVEYDRLAALVRRSLNMDLVYQITGLEVAVP